MHGVWIQKIGVVFWVVECVSVRVGPVSGFNQWDLYQFRPEHICILESRGMCCSATDINRADSLYEMACKVIFKGRQGYADVRMGHSMFA